MHDSTTRHATRALAPIASFSRELPTVFMIGPRPRPAPPPCSREGAAREAALSERIVRCLVYHTMPHVCARASRLGRAVGPAVVLRIGVHATECDTVTLCQRLVQSLAPGLHFVSVCLPVPVGTDAHCALLDDDAAAIAAAPLVLIDYCHDAKPAGGATAGSMRSAHHESPVAHEQTYTVGWSPGVYVRAEPRLDARPIGVRRAGTLVRAKCMWGPWIEVGPAADSPDTPSYGGRGAGGWMLADGDAIGCGRMLSPCGEGAREHKWQHGRDARTMLGFENALAAWKQHPMLSVLRTEHALRGLPMVATEDACALLGAGVGGVRLFPWRVRPLRGAVDPYRQSR